MSSIIERIIDAAPSPADTPEHFVAELKPQLSKWLNNLTAVSMHGVAGAPDWLGYEMKVWKLGESLREILSKDKKWRKSDSLIGIFGDIVKDKKYGKGREPYLELIAKYGDSRCYPVLIDSLDDEEIIGHAIKSVRIAKLVGHDELMKDIINDDYPRWIKKEADKYLKSSF